AGPPAQPAREGGARALTLSVAEWVAFERTRDSAEDLRHSAATCTQTRTVVAGRDPVAIDAWLVRNLMAETPSINRKAHFDLDDADAKLTKFLRYYRQIRGVGAIDPALITAT